MCRGICKSQETLIRCIEKSIQIRFVSSIYKKCKLSSHVLSSHLAFTITGGSKPVSRLLTENFQTQNNLFFFEKQLFLYMLRAESRRLRSRSKVTFTHNQSLAGKVETSTYVQNDITELLVRKGNLNCQFVNAHTAKLLIYLFSKIFRQ